MSIIAGPTTLFYQWSSAWKNLSLALDAFNDISKTLSSLDRRLSVLHEPILQAIETGLPKLQSEVDDFILSVTSLRRLRNTSSLLSPVNRLPAEILTAIFALAVHDSKPPRPGPRGISTPKIIDFTTVIASVGSYWRQVALSTPELWSYIDLDPRDELEYQTLWLKRAANNPLHIRYVDSRLVSSVNNGKNMFDMMQPHFHRSESLHIAVDINPGQEIVLEACTTRNESSPNLRSLTLFSSHSFTPCFPDSQEPPQSRQIENFLRSLRILRLYGTNIDAWGSRILHNLVELTLDSMEGPHIPTPRQLYDVIRASPDLRALRLTSFAIVDPNDSVVDRVSLEKLEMLSLRGVPIRFVHWLLGLLVPRLEGATFVIDYRHADSQDFSIGLGIPLAAPDRVKMLYLRSLRQRDLDIHKLLLFMPNLETLALYKVRINWVGLPVSDSGICYPQLLFLDMSNCSTGKTHDFEDVLQQHSVARVRMYGPMSAPDDEWFHKRVPGLVVETGRGDFIEELSTQYY